METHANAKGRIVLPSLLRRKYGIKAGTKIIVYDEGERIILKPVTEQHLKKLQGALKALRQGRAEDRERE